MVTRHLIAAATLAALCAGASARVLACQHDSDDPDAREEAARSVSWTSEDAGPADDERQVHVKLLGFNDFHGHLAKGGKVAGKPVGGAAWLATYLKQAQAGLEDRTFIVHAGDHVGASPAESALLGDEPSVSFLNLLANDFCSYEDVQNPHCNIVGTTGNHEYDHGATELLRLIYGGNSPAGPFLEDPWRGARYPMIVSNVVDTVTGEPLLPPYVVKVVNGVRIAFIGAVLRGTPSIVSAAGIAGLSFLDEPTTINRYVHELQDEGIHAFVVTIHQGGFESNYVGPTQAAPPPVSGEILDIVSRLDDDVDVVISGHSHAFSNALLPNANGTPILVAQAFSYGTAFDEIDLTLDRTTKDVVAKSAKVVTVFQTRPDGTAVTPDPAVAALVQQAVDRVAPLVNRVVGHTNTDLLRAQNTAGESNLGDLIADAQRAAMGADFGVMNPGGIRGDLYAGDLTWGALFTVQPFGNALTKATFTGAQVYALLEQQWAGQASPKMLQVSGLTYTWDAAQPVGSRVVEVRKDGVAIDKAANYTVSANSFLAAGGDNFSVLKSGTNRVGGPVDLDALVAYVQAHSPLSVAIDGRVVRLH